ncbi:unnamed protein product [Blepharisma stoltei]|uniref:Protein kinase domain-containing protein n=1 Tax=Blepharisma stoltei TaxID=1481888 RepID=A0AAU9J975_9CILI|nr:unnamed protein product [Blepharisma stoltei]
MKLIIRGSDNFFEVNIGPNSKVKDLKVEIARITMIPPPLQKLSIFSSGMKVLLPTSSKISLYNISDGAEIFLDEKAIENAQAPEAPLDDEPKRMVRRHTLQPRVSSKPTARSSKVQTQAPAQSIEPVQEEEPQEPEIPEDEHEPWLTRCIMACQEGEAEMFVEALQDYMRARPLKVLEESVAEILNARYNDKWSCIHYCCYMGHANVLKEIIDLGGNCNIETDDHWTPLQIASYQGHKNCVEMLVSHPLIQINKMTAERGTGLHLASSMGHAEIVEILLNHKASLKLEDPYGKTALELATNIKVAELIPKYLGEEMLEKYGKKSNEKPKAFTGEAFSTATWQINDKLVFLVMDTERGLFGQYSTKNSYLEGQNPDVLIPFVDIQEVKNLNSGIAENKFFFVVNTQDITLKYYTNTQDLTNSWVSKLINCVNFFQTYAHNPENRDFLENQEGERISMKLRGIKTNMNFEEEAIEYHHDEGQTINYDSFDVLEELGAGSFGHVYKVVKKNSGEIYAMKVLSKQMLREKNQLKYAIAECKILKNIRHPYIVPLYWAFQTPNSLYMVLEYCPNGDLSKLLEYAQSLNVSISKFYIAEVILAIEYLHSLDIVYRDLKPQNLLLDSNGHIKLADFGLAKENVTEENPAMSFCGSPAYLPPEQIAGTGAWKPADIYCIGANLYELLTGQPPFYTENISVLYQRISKSKLKFPEGLDEEAENLIQAVMKRNPEERPSIQDVKEHPFFYSINWSDMLAMKIPPPIGKDDFVRLKQAMK